MTCLRVMLVVSLAVTVMGCLELRGDGERLAEFVEESIPAPDSRPTVARAANDVSLSKLVTEGRQFEREGAVSITIWAPTDASVGTCAPNVDAELYGPLL